MACSMGSLRDSYFPERVYPVNAFTFKMEEAPHDHLEFHPNRFCYTGCVSTF